MLNQDKINEIIDKTDIVSLVSDYVELKKRGKNYFGLCPFHDDENPSFSVSPEKKIAKCMSCGEGGNPINFLKKIKNISFNEAALELAKKYNVEVDIEDNVNPKANTNAKYYKIMDAASKYYENYLFNSKSGLQAIKYLEDRGMTKEEIKRFRLGLAPKDRALLYQYLKNLGYQDITLEDLGLIKVDDNGPYDVFNNRVTFPIIDDNNHVLGFSARIYYQSDTEPRYVNSTETPIYQKGNTLFNIYNAIPHIRKKHFVILVEGQMDVVALDNKGIQNVICSLGTAFTIEQAKLIKKYTENIIIMYDGDNAGINSTKKVFKLLKGFKAYAVTLPDKQDPDEYLRTHTANDLLTYINQNSKDKYNFLIDSAFKDINLDDYYQINDAKAEIFASLKEEKDLLILDLAFKKIASILNVSEESIKNEFAVENASHKEDKQEEKKQETIYPANHERMYIALICYKKEYFEYFNEKLQDISLFTDNNMVLDIYMCVSFFYSNEETNTRKLIEYIHEELKQDYIYDVYEDLVKLASFSDETIDHMIKDIIKRFKDVNYRLDLDKYKVSTKMSLEEQTEMLNQRLKVLREKNKK